MHNHFLSPQQCTRIPLVGLLFMNINFFCYKTDFSVKYESLGKRNGKMRFCSLLCAYQEVLCASWRVGGGLTHAKRCACTSLLEPV
jgi:hypothetical protein